MKKKIIQETQLGKSALKWFEINIGLVSKLWRARGRQKCWGPQSCQAVKGHSVAIVPNILAVIWGMGDPGIYLSLKTSLLYV